MVADDGLGRAEDLHHKLYRETVSAGNLSAPPRPNDMPFWKGAAALVLALGVMFPMAGAAIIVVLLIDATLLRMIPAMKRAVS